jgi:ZIP family zinc transporter
VGEAFFWGAVGASALLADTMLPEAFDVEGVFTGTLVVSGFAVSIMLSAV